MMPVAGMENNYGYGEDQIDYKSKYKTLKKKLKLLVYEQECFLEELRKAQRKLLKVSRDRSFLLDRLLQYEKVNDSSGDSDATASSDSDGDGGHKDTPAKKRKLVGSSPGQSILPAELAQLIGSAGLAAQASAAGGGDSGKKKKSSLKKGKSGTKSGGKGGKNQPAGQMTREELERHLDAKQHSFGIEKTPTLLPMEIFSNDNSNPDSLSDIMGGDEEDTDLVIDVPN